MTIVDFLLARIAEDEAVARAGEDDWAVPDGIAYCAVGLGSDRAFVHTIDPARVLAECAAKRAIVDYFGGWIMAEPAARTTLRALAQPYADHPDFDPAWRA